MLNEGSAPVDKLMPLGTQDVLIALSALGALLIWAYAIRESRRRRDLVPLLVVAGCGLAVFYEPLGDELAKVYYSERGQIPWISAFGRHIPVFIGLLYFWYMSVWSMWLLRASKRGVTARRWWTVWAGFLLFATGLEMLAAKGLSDAHSGPWTYYGHQGFEVLNVPFFTPWTYISIGLPIAVGAVAVARWLPARLHWVLLPAVPMLMAAGHMMTALPSALALNSTSSQFLNDLGALGSAAFAVLLSYLASQAFRRPWGLDRAELDRLRLDQPATVGEPARTPVAA
jgi:hypothetical protein